MTERTERGPGEKVKDHAQNVLGPVADFFRAETVGGAVLLGATVVALIWANTPAREIYDSLWTTDLRLGTASFGIEEDLRHWVNDGLMVVFFFVVGLEVKRELVTGELADRRAAALPALGAVGGMVLPGVLFAAIVAGGPGASGWAIPMATDIAFAIGVLALLGDRISAGVRLLLLSIAVVDDILAVSIIALFYSGGLSPAWLAGAAVGLLAVVGLRRLGVTSVWAYVLLGLAVWVATHESGVHATIAGVALGLLTPARPVAGRPVLERLEHRLHPLSSAVVVPLFALANAGVPLGGGALAEAAQSRLAWAIVAGLVLGKLIGITVAIRLGLRIGAATLPADVRRRNVPGVAALGGIGFTVSLFITGLAFDEPALQDVAKVGIFAGSLLGGLLGLAIFAWQTRVRPSRGEQAA